MFDLTAYERKIVNDFVRDHNCGLESDEFGKKVGAIGGRFTYHFTPTSLGLISSISCGCGAKETLTNFDEW